MQIQTLYSSVPQPHATIWAGFDLAAIGVVGATLIGWLPNIAAGLSCIYLTLQILIAFRNYRKDKSDIE